MVLKIHKSGRAPERLSSELAFTTSLSNEVQSEAVRSRPEPGSSQTYFGRRIICVILRNLSATPARVAFIRAQSAVVN